MRADKCIISKFTTSQRYKTGNSRSDVISSISTDDGYHGRVELDSHADTIIAGKNCLTLSYSGRVCDVSAYSEDYPPRVGVPVVSAATGYTTANGDNYILIFNEALSIPDLDHSLVNPNQLRYHGVMVQDNPFSDIPMMITAANDKFQACLLSKGTVIYFDSWLPSQSDLEMYPHVELSSSTPWTPQSIEFPSLSYSEREEIESRNIASFRRVPDNYSHDDQLIYDVNSFNSSLISSVRIDHDYKSKNGISSIKSIGPLSEDEMNSPPTYISTERHSDISPEDLSERWQLSIAQAKLTLGATTQRLSRSAVMPIARRYRVDRMFGVRRLRCNISTDTMDARCESMHGNRYCQVFGNKEFFCAAYPIAKKSDCGLALDKFVREFGAPSLLIFDGSKEQTGRRTAFQAALRKYEIPQRVSEPQRHNQNPVEGVIRELRKKWYRTVFRTNCPLKLWDYAIPYIARIMCLTASDSGKLNGRTPMEYITGETPDISEYLDFSFWDWVWYKENAGIGETKLAKFMGTSQSIGSLMSYWILPISGIPESRTTVQRLTTLEMKTDVNAKRFCGFDKAILNRFKEARLAPKGDKPDLSEWDELLTHDEDFANEFNRVFDNSAVLEQDDIDDESDNYVNMELTVDDGSENPQLARVTKRLKDASGHPIGTANDNPVLDTRLYEVQYMDGYKTAMTANNIAENLFSQIDAEGRRYILLDEIVDIRNDGSQLKEENAFVVSANGVKRRIETTRGWEVCLKWKDGTTTWNKLKDVKDSYPIQLAEYALENRLDNKAVFAWWVPFVLKKRDRVISKIKSKYWQRTHKYGIRIPKSVKEALKIDRENNNTLWWDAIMLKMKNVRPAFEVYEGDVKDLPVGYQRIDCHIIFDVKLGENFRRKARLVAGGHTTSTPTSLTYSSVVSRDSVRVALTAASLNGLSLLACDIKNAYLTANCRERIYTYAGPEFGSEEGQCMIVKMALYGLKSSGAAFRAKLANLLYELQYRASEGDPDVWLRPAMKPNGFKYYEYALCYVDDILVISHQPLSTMDDIKKVFKLKGDKAVLPSMYLGVSLSLVENANGTKCWSMSSEDYTKMAIKTIEDRLAKCDMRLPNRCTTPYKSAYHPAHDTSAELDAEGIQYFQELIGMLRWAVELGRVDILLEVSLLSSFLASPRVGHLQQAYHIFGYLKNVGKRTIYLDPDEPIINESRFQSFNWEDFYRGAQEPISPNMPEPRGKEMRIHCFVDSDHASDKESRRSQTGILIFCNRAPVMWYSKRQNSVQSSTFGAEFNALKIATEMVQGLRHKLRSFGIPMSGPSNVFCDNEAVYKNATIPESVLSKKHHSVAYHVCRQVVASKMLRIAKEDSAMNLADPFTKVMNRPKRERLFDMYLY